MRKSLIHTKRRLCQIWWIKELLDELSKSSLTNLYLSALNLRCSLARSRAFSLSLRLILSLRLAFVALRHWRDSCLRSCSDSPSLTAFLHIRFGELFNSLPSSPSYLVDSGVHAEDVLALVVHERRNVLSEFHTSQFRSDQPPHQLAAP